MWCVCGVCASTNSSTPTSRLVMKWEEECEGLAGLHQGVNGYLRDAHRHRLSPASPGSLLYPRKIDMCCTGILTRNVYATVYPLSLSLKFGRLA